MAQVASKNPVTLASLRPAASDYRNPALRPSLANGNPCKHMVFEQFPSQPKRSKEGLYLSTNKQTDAEKTNMYMYICIYTYTYVYLCMPKTGIPFLTEALPTQPLYVYFGALGYRPQSRKLEASWLANTPPTPSVHWKVWDSLWKLRSAKPASNKKGHPWQGLQYHPPSATQPDPTNSC